MRFAGILLMVLAAMAGCAGDPNSQQQAGTPTSSGDDDDGAALDARCVEDNGGIKLPEGFCASIFADNPGKKIRHIAVTPGGYVFVAVQPSMPDADDDHVLALFDADNDGIAELQDTIGDIGGNGIAWRDGLLYVAANDRVVRYDLPDGRLTPEDATPTVMVSGLPADGDHAAKTVVLSGDTMFLNFGSASNTCQVANRQLHSPGMTPCRELSVRAGVWAFDANRIGQDMSCGSRFATGLRNTNALALHPETETLWGAINGRDQLHENWPELFTAQQDKLLPSEEVVAITKQTDRGWPFCYHDMAAKQMKLAPEYGGDGVKQGRCSAIREPAAAIDAHAAPLGMVFAAGTQFPEAYRSGLFVANHGSRFDPNVDVGLHGYDVEFLPFVDGEATGEIQKFATSFDAGLLPLPEAAPHRPVGLAMMPDGSLLIGDDKGGRIWRVFFTGTDD
jgi:glucose/arabinose dehydrogenase